MEEFEEEKGGTMRQSRNLSQVKKTAGLIQHTFDRAWKYVILGESGQQFW